MTLLWLDLETSGLDPQRHDILEIAWTFTNDDLSPMFSLGVQSYLIRERDGVQWDRGALELHQAHGLIEAQEKETLTDFGHVEHALWVQLCDFETRTVKLAGSSIHFDLGFIREHMPAVAKLLSHRIYDVSTLKAHYAANGIESDYLNTQPHRAASDVRESLAIARFFHEKLTGMSEY
jgi:oligoribonuclease